MLEDGVLIILILVIIPLCVYVCVYKIIMLYNFNIYNYFVNYPSINKVGEKVL